MIFYRFPLIQTCWLSQAICVHLGSNYPFIHRSLFCFVISKAFVDSFQIIKALERKVTRLDARNTFAPTPNIMVKTQRPLSPPTFNGKSDIQDWLFALELFLQSCSWERLWWREIQIIMARLKRPELKWWMSYLSTNHCPDSFHGFRGAVVSKLQPIDPVIRIV
jgi:hypothetical protein